MGLKQGVMMLFEIEVMEENCCPSNFVLFRCRPITQVEPEADSDTPYDSADLNLDVQSIDYENLSPCGPQAPLHPPRAV